MWAQAINAVLGIWLMMCPWILNFGGSGRIVDRIAGPIALTFGFWAMRSVTRFVRYFNVLIGAWVLITPWAFHFTNWVPIINNILVGIALIAFALVRGRITESFGVGWLGVLIAGREDLMHWWKKRQQRKRLGHRLNEQRRHLHEEQRKHLQDDQPHRVVPRP